MDKVPIYLWCWHVLKAQRLHGTEKIKDVGVWCGILQDLHDVTIDDFKERGRVAVRKNLHKHRPGDAWTNYF